MRGTSWLLILIVVLVGSAAGILGGSYLATRELMPGGIPNPINAIRPFDGKRHVTILMIGEDNTGRGRGHGLSDTLVVMAIDTQTREVRAISIPRDTLTRIPGHGNGKINSANAHGGPELARRSVNNLLGADIDYYVSTNPKGLRGLVDMLGGVYMVVEKNMRYTDRRGGLFINLKASPEKQLLNGDQAEQYVRFRHDAHGDSGYEIKNGKKVAAGRVVRQQKFMRALANRVLSLPRSERLATLQKAREKEFIVSDMQMADWKGLMDILKDFNPETMNMAVLPGQPGNVGNGSYWIPDTSAIPEVVAQNLLFQSAPPEAAPTVEVLNGSGIAGAARRVAEKLRGAGLEVERTDNAPNSGYTECSIITRRGRIVQVETIAQMLNCDNIKEEEASSDKPAITVIVGSNYRAALAYRP